MPEFECHVIITIGQSLVYFVFIFFLFVVGMLLIFLLKLLILQKFICRILEVKGNLFAKRGERVKNDESSKAKSELF